MIEKMDIAVALVLADRFTGQELTELALAVAAGPDLVRGRGTLAAQTMAAPGGPWPALQAILAEAANISLSRWTPAGDVDPEALAAQLSGLVRPETGRELSLQVATTLGIPADMLITDEQASGRAYLGARDRAVKALFDRSPGD